MRREFVIVSLFILTIEAISYFYFPWFLWSLIIFLPIICVGTWDMLQNKHAILKNFPIAGHFRYWLEMIRPEINQYFIESNQDGVPFSREQRSLVYQRAKKQLDTLPFGTQGNVYSVGYEWVNHSLAAKKNAEHDYRVVIGEGRKKPYSASILNISAMSYGSLSKTAIMSLNAGAKIGGFAHNTGEGGISPYHLKHGGDLIWQIGTGYFGCRTSQGDFCEELFAKNSQQDNVKMIEIKLSQGAKPGHGGILPAAKVTKEISEIRNVPMGQDVLSPPGHKAFNSPIGLLQFVEKLRVLSGEKPIGFKLCLGKKSEFLAICKAMIESGITPDFITVDGGEGGTGAAPLEFSNHIGCPLREAQIFVHNALVGFGVRDKIKLIVSGKVISGFDVISRIALGADLCYSARGMMLALGCIQALRCNSNDCPSGVATQEARFYKGIVVEDKKQRVANYHRGTLHGVAEILGAMGLEHPNQLKPYHLMRRVAFNEVRDYSELYEYLKSGDLLGENIPDSYKIAYKHAHANSFSVQRKQNSQRKNMRKICLLFLVLCTITAEDIRTQIAALSEEIEAKVIQWRRHFHQYPELSNREFKTAAKIEEILRKLDVEIKTQVAHTGVVALLKGGKPGPVVALRADMDALPIVERVDLPFASKEKAIYNGKEVGVMHACGHDTHVAILLGVAEVLTTIKSDLKGSVKFIFQPAEEGAPEGEEGGAELMVKQGVLQNPQVDVIFGLHINSTVEVGTIGYRPGGAMASFDGLYITVKGKQTHGAYPWAGVDPIVTSAQIIMGLQTTISRHAKLIDGAAIVTIGSIHGGNRGNIIPETVEMVGTIRALDPQMQKKVHEDIHRVVKNIAKSAGAVAEVHIKRGYPVTYNDPKLTLQMAPTFKRVAGEDHVFIRNAVTGAEDFSFFQQQVPGLFFFLGGRPKNITAEEAPPHHSPDFHIDDSGLKLGVETMCNLVVDYMDQKSK